MTEALKSAAAGIPEFPPSFQTTHQIKKEIPKAFCFGISLCVAFNLKVAVLSSDMPSASMLIFDIL